MPHLILSVSAQLAPHQKALLQAAHTAMLDSAIAPAFDIKSRAMVWDDFAIGEGSTDAFAYVEIRLLQKPERTEAVQKALSDAIMQALAQALPPQHMDVQLSCDMVAMNTAVYGKHRVVAAD